MLVLLAALFLCVLTAVFCWRPAERGTVVTVTVDGELYGQYPLSEERVIALAHNTIVIRGGEVYMENADCPDQSCVRQGHVSSGVIACLPNRVIVRVGVSGGEYDVVVGKARIR